jgi:hypothetical protein
VEPEAEVRQADLLGLLVESGRRLPATADKPDDVKNYLAKYEALAHCARRRSLYVADHY